MSERPPAVVGRGRPPAIAVPPGWTAVALAELPDEPYDLRTRHFVVTATVADHATAEALLLAAVRGVAVVVTVTLDEAAADDFVDDLARIATVRGSLPPPGTIEPEHVALLDALAAGLTVTEAASQLGWSRRTAHRRLAEARRRLGAATTAEALRRHRADDAKSGAQ